MRTGIRIIGHRCHSEVKDALIKFAKWLGRNYEDEKIKRGRDNALASYLVSLAHEIIHYEQWLKNNEFYERGVAVKASNIVDKYASTVDHP